MNFRLELTPPDGPYVGGVFPFTVLVDDNYPMLPPKVRCTAKIYHPNLDYEGNVCLNILREDWLPALSLLLVLIGLQYLFLAPNPMDPLNKEAANQMAKDRDGFMRAVRASMDGGSVGGEQFDRVRK